MRLFILYFCHCNPKLIEISIMTTMNIQHTDVHVIGRSNTT